MNTRLKVGSSLVILFVMLGCGLLPSIPEPTITPIRPSTSTPSHPGSVQTVPSVNTPEPVIGPTATRLAKATGVQLTLIRMIDVQNGWGLGSIGKNPTDLVLHTFDGGATWHNVTPSAILADSVAGGQTAAGYFRDVNKAWVIFSAKDLSQPVNSIVIWRTTDAGRSWLPSQPLDLTNVGMDFFKASDLGFTIDQTGYLLVHLGAGTSHDYVAVFTSPDGGLSWIPVVSPKKATIPMTCGKSGVRFRDGKNGWISGDCPGLMPGIYLYRTSDGGLNWQAVDLPIPNNQPDVFRKDISLCGLPQAPVYVGERGVYLVVRCSTGDANTILSWVYISRDGGQNWVSELLPAADGNLLFLDFNVGWFLSKADKSNAGKSKLYRSLDTGMSWSVISQMIWNGPLDFWDPQVGWVIASTSGASTLVKTTNGGGTWKDQKPVVVP